jgi:phenylalanyl-tRNA synthetase beta chain
MKFPVEWLREFVPTTLDDKALADKLTMAGLEVEEITPSEDGPVYHTKVTPNRGDWMSLLGVARETAATLDTKMSWLPTPLPDENDDVRRWAGVVITDTALCPRYAGKVVRNVTIGPSPDWIQKRIAACGMRPVNVVVDVTNYVMLELGQPLHAFDYDTIPEGKIVVRPANAGETIVTLDGAERALQAGMLVIADREKPIAVAGVMGGAETEVTDSTRHIFLEAAQFDPGSIRRTSKVLGLSTDASYRFERTVDPELVPLALERAAELLADLAGGEVALGRIDLYPAPKRALPIEIRPTRTNAILGTDLTDETIAQSLTRLGLIVDASASPFKVLVPTFRTDLLKEIDLIEEVGRMIGYDTLPETLPPSAGGGGVDAPRGKFAGDLRTVLTSIGLQEALTHSLAAPSPFDDPEKTDERVAIRLALSAELSGLRQSLLPNLLGVLSHNLRQREPDVRLFEVGKVFAKGEGVSNYLETRSVAGVLTGAVSPRRWTGEEIPSIDFYAAKGVVEALFTRLRLPAPQFVPGHVHGMHPGRTALIQLDGKTIGYVAELDPDAVKSDLNVPASVGRVAAFELDADALLAVSADTRHYTPLPRFPAVTRVLAVVVDSEVGYWALESTARSVVEETLLEEIAPESIYTGEKIGEGKKSVAIRFVFRAADRTLTDAEVETQMRAVETALAERVGAVHR